MVTRAAHGAYRDANLTEEGGDVQIWPNTTYDKN